MRLGSLFRGAREESVEQSDVRSALRPAPPIAKRLNRNALTLAALMMGMTVLTVIVVLNPSKDSKDARTVDGSVDQAPVVPARPAFLDAPARPTPLNPLRARDPASATSPASSAAAPPLIPPVHEPGSANALDQPSPRAGLESRPTDTSPAERHESAHSDRDRAYHAALMSPALVSQATSRAIGRPGAPASALESEEQQLVTLGDSIMRSSMQPTGAGFAAGAGTHAELPTETPAMRSNQSTGIRLSHGSPSHLSTELEEAGSPYTLRAGTVIPGLLITGINSELPGEIVGQVSRDVYDTRAQQLLLIPKGARLIGSYDNQIAAGQGRLLVAWTRLILPDGRSLHLPGLALTDREGQSGAKDKVDNHWWRVFGTAVLLSAIGAGAQLSQPAHATVLSTPSAGQVAAGAVGQELSNAALEILRRGMNVAPTIIIRAGQPFNVFLNGDLAFDAPYAPHG